MVLDPIPQSLPVHFFGSRPQPPTSPCVAKCLLQISHVAHMTSRIRINSRLTSHSTRANPALSSRKVALCLINFFLINFFNVGFCMRISLHLARMCEVMSRIRLRRSHVTHMTGTCHTFVCYVALGGTGRSRIL